MIITFIVEVGDVTDQGALIDTSQDLGMEYLGHSGGVYVFRAQADSESVFFSEVIEPFMLAHPSIYTAIETII
jgi:hypothetical protein